MKTRTLEKHNTTQQQKKYTREITKNSLPLTEYPSFKFNYLPRQDYEENMKHISVNNKQVLDKKNTPVVKNVKGSLTLNTESLDRSNSRILLPKHSEKNDSRHNLSTTVSYSFDDERVSFKEFESPSNYVSVPNVVLHSLRSVSILKDKLDRGLQILASRSKSVGVENDDMQNPDQYFEESTQSLSHPSIQDTTDPMQNSQVDIDDNDFESRSLIEMPIVQQHPMQYLEEMLNGLRQSNEFKDLFTFQTYEETFVYTDGGRKELSVETKESVKIDISPENFTENNENGFGSTTSIQTILNNMFYSKREIKENKKNKRNERRQNKESKYRDYYISKLPPMMVFNVKRSSDNSSSFIDFDKLEISESLNFEKARIRPTRDCDGAEYKQNPKYELISVIIHKKNTCSITNAATLSHNISISRNEENHKEWIKCEGHHCISVEKSTIKTEAAEATDIILIYEHLEGSILKK